MLTHHASHPCFCRKTRHRTGLPANVFGDTIYIYKAPSSHSLRSQQSQKMDGKVAAAQGVKAAAGWMEDGND